LMVFGFCFCSKQNERNMEIKTDNKRVLQMIKDANGDPQNAFKRRSIISQIDCMTDLKILEINDFTLKGTLGSGISSEVCLLVRNKDKRKFAGKFINSNISTKDFVNEANIMKSCSTACSTIVKLIGITTYPKCLVLAYYGNGSLDIALRKDNISVERGKETEFPFLRRLGYILDMCKAVHQLHRENICHRDIALRNLLLSDDKEHVVLTDFSLSRVVRSALETQSTLTALVPTKSAPETIRKSKFTSGSQNWERWYSLKTDIWSLGVAMFEIIDKELGHIKGNKHLPSKFSRKRQPSANVFNRMEDLWILILRCWSERPAERPQIWDVQERIEKLIEDPLDVVNEADDCYITEVSTKGITRIGSISDEQKLMSLSSRYIMQGAYSSMNLDLTCGSLILDSPTCVNIPEQESADDIMPIMMQDFMRKISSYKKRRDAKFQITGAKDQSKNNQKWSRLNIVDGENRFNKHLLQPGGRCSTDGHTDNMYLSQGSLQRLNFPLGKNKSDPSINNPYSQVKELRSRLDSASSFQSVSLSSLYEESVTRDRVEYCEPLPGSFRSEATNIKYCKERQFFKSIREQLNVDEKPNTCDSVRSLEISKAKSVDENIPALEPTDPLVNTLI